MYKFSHKREDPSLKGPLKKVERAATHIEDLKTQLRSFLEPWGYEVKHHFEGDPPSFVVTVGEGRFPLVVPDGFSLLAGEAIYQLRTALDHLIIELIRANKQEPSPRNMWPVLSQKHERSLKIKTQGVSWTAFKRIESFQPYSCGTNYKEHPLWTLNKFSNWDKHNFLIRTFLARFEGFKIECSDGPGEPRSFGLAATGIKPGDKYCFGQATGLRPGMKVKVESKPKMMLEDVTMPRFPGFPLHSLTSQPSQKELSDPSKLWNRYTETDTVSPILFQLSEEVRMVVCSFRGEFVHYS